MCPKAHSGSEVIETVQIPLKTAPDGQPDAPAACPECGAQLVAGRKNKRFCSSSCKNRFHYKGGPLERLADLERRVAELERAMGIPPQTDRREDGRG